MRTGTVAGTAPRARLHSERKNSVLSSPVVGQRSTTLVHTEATWQGVNKIGVI